MGRANLLSFWHGFFSRSRGKESRSKGKESRSRWKESRSKGKESRSRGKESSQSESDVALLEGKNDKYDGIIVEPASLPSDPSKFQAMLKKSLAHWKTESKKGIWLKLPIENVDFAPAAVKEGFKYHHAEKDYLMLTCWISDSPCTLPANASHQVGIGAMVINDENKILVVQEATGPTKGSGNWKIPTGVVSQGEDVNEAAEREVKEETGVDAEFVEVLGVRQTHTAPFGKSDIFFLCLLRPKSADVVKQDTEIAAVQWMPVEEYRSQEFNARSELMKRFADIITALSKQQYTGFMPERLLMGSRGPGAFFYHNTRDINRLSAKESLPEE
ncbi:hypothetical protein KP509_05G049500 [Ceratopteris richardii]|uniref:Nudix hydrolase domain-containing protein n=2 Tax=Ceratopteris richardii TaxID=49495 RepID=A0A8T2UNK8_CERRI|nr:hypothetical protein KP509_05G049500 [Ceratopteris richardii]